MMKYRILNLELLWYQADIHFVIVYKYTLLINIPIGIQLNFYRRNLKQILFKDLFI